MTRLSSCALLLAGCATTPVATAQTRPVPPYAATQAPVVTPRQQPAAVPVLGTPDAVPATTAAQAIPIVPASGPRLAPLYRPDFGGALSGMRDRDDDAAMPVLAPVRSLTEAITLAYRTNPNLLAARAQARSADYRIPQARSAYGPSVTATGSYSFTRTRVEVIPGTFAGAQGWSTTAAAVLNQPVFTFGRNAAAEAGAVATAQFQRDSLRVIEAQTLNQVVTAYVSVLRDAASVTISRQNLALLAQQYRENQARYKVRDLTLTDLDQTQTRVELGRAQLLQAEGQLGVSQKQFLQYVGAPPGDLSPPDLLDVKFTSVDAAYGYAEANSPLIRAAQAREKISRAAVSAARAEYLPRVDLRGTADYGSVSPYTDRLRTTQLVGQAIVTQPLFDSGLRRARVGEAREANQADWRLLDQTMRDTRSTIGASWDQLASSRTSLASYRAAIAAAQRAYDGALIQQKAGDRTTLDVLDLARDLLTVRTNYNFAVANEYLSRAALLAAVGMLEGPAILPGLTAYDADAHTRRIYRKSDVPFLTDVLAPIDGLTVGNTTRDRASRDAGAQQGLAEAVRLPPPDPVTPN